MEGRSTSEVFLGVDPTVTSQGAEAPTVNATYDSFSNTCSENLLQNFLIAIICLAGLVGNAAVVYLLGCSMRRSAISVYILNLAVSDFFFLSCQFISSLLMATTSFYTVHVIVFNIAVTPYIAGLSMLGAIGIERCLAVLWPIWYRCHRPRHLSAVVCALLWALSLLLSLVEWCFDFQNVYSGNILQAKFDFIIAAWLVFLFLTLSGSSLGLVVRIFCGPRRIPLSRLYVTILLTVLVFLICGLPFGMYWFLLYWFQIDIPNFFCYFFLATVVLSCINSCANPIIYFFTGSFRQHHQALKLVLQRALQDSSHGNESGDRHV